LMIGIIGVAVLVGTDVRGSALLAVGEITITAVSYAFGPMIVGRYLQGVQGLDVVTASLVLTALAYSPFALTHLPQRLDGEVVSSVIVLIVVCTAIAFLAFYALIQEVGAVRATVVTYVNPAVAIVLGVLILNEPFTLGVALGFPLVLVGSYLATTSPKATPRTSEAAELPVR
jgi:drug/metabolite transporter (DMT)-like permease